MDGIQLFRLLFFSFILREYIFIITDSLTSRNFQYRTDNKTGRMLSKKKKIMIIMSS